jgi:hypothetical protein
MAGEFNTSGWHVKVLMGPCQRAPKRSDLVDRAQNLVDDFGMKSFAAMKRNHDALPGTKLDPMAAFAAHQKKPICEKLSLRLGRGQPRQFRHTKPPMRSRGSFLIGAFELQTV